MNIQTKTPVQIVQELIAIHTDRIELVQKCEGKSIAPDIRSMLTSAKQQSEKYTAELMNELSEFGDAVMASVDHQNDYQVMYKSVLGQLDSMPPTETEQTFRLLEETLKSVYQTVLQTGVELPASLQEIISKQENNLEL